MTGPRSPRSVRSPRPVRPRRLGSAAAVLAVVAVLVAAAGCGVPLDDSPRAITRTTLAGDGTVTSPPTTSDTPGAATVPVYFLDSGRLQQARYPVEGEPSLRKALQLVLGGPQDQDRSSLSTSIPPDTRLIEVTVSGHEAVIDLTSEMGEISGQPGKQAFAQLVFTALAYTNIDTVRFRVEGEPVAAPTDRGNLQSVTAGDYDQPLNPG